MLSPKKYRSFAQFLQQFILHKYINYQIIIITIQFRYKYISGLFDSSVHFMKLKIKLRLIY